MSEALEDQQRPPVRHLEEQQRRVLGVLLEKAFTTPDAYPLTIKAIATGSSQKSNRDPVQDYSEDEVSDALHELQELGLIAEVHTDGGRTARYRHLVRKRYAFSEPQLAILTELWLRGRQQMGELRTRASRMVNIESQEVLRDALQPLLADGYVQANGPLERRGVEVDHGFYPDGEYRAAWSAAGEESSPRSASSGSTSAPASALQNRCSELEQRVDELESRLSDVEDKLARLAGG
ncbi:MAG: DUF480 domain-containing protein [Planctomycetaceae bacterium]